MSTSPASSSKSDALAPPTVSNPRRRSVDVGGLALALNSQDQGRGSGWGDWSEDPTGNPEFAELLTAMYTESQALVNTKLKELPPSLAISEEDRMALINSLDDWDFEPQKLTMDDCLACALLIFDALYHIDGFQDEIGIDIIRDVCPFLRHLRLIYRAQNAYHNFEHAVDVLQAMHSYLVMAGIVPPVIVLRTPEVKWRRPYRPGPPRLIDNLTNDDLFALYVAAVGHDVGHPGFTNMFMKNAQAPLSKVFDDKSALEQMHCSLLLQIMRHHGLGILLGQQPGMQHARLPQPETEHPSYYPHSSAGGSTVSSPNGSRILPPKAATSQHPDFRRLLLGTVLATDMGVHFQFMHQFTELVNAFNTAPRETATPAEKLLLGQALLKCADISNPSRPAHVSEQWATALMSEWNSQDQLERHLHLPFSTPAKDGGAENPVNECNVQIGFIKMFVKPLLEITVMSTPDLQPLLTQCNNNLAMWETRLSEIHQPQSSVVHPVHHSAETEATQSLQPNDFLSVFPLSLPEGMRSASPTAINSVIESISPQESALVAVTRGVSPTPSSQEVRSTARQQRRVENVSSSQSYTVFRCPSRSLSPEYRMPGAFPLDDYVRTSRPAVSPHDQHPHHHAPQPSTTSISSFSTSPAMSPSTSSPPTASPTTIPSPASFLSFGSSPSNGTFTSPLDKSTEQMRAAYSASVRKKPSRVFNRASWNPPYVGIPLGSQIAFKSPLSNNSSPPGQMFPSTVLSSTSTVDLSTPRALSLLIPTAPSSAQATTSS